MAMQEYYVFEWIKSARGAKLGSLIAPDRVTAWNAASKMYDTPNVHVQTKADYEAEMKALNPHPAA